MKNYQNYVRGKWVASSSGKAFEDRNPARWEEIIGTFPRSTAQDLDRAVSAAKNYGDSCPPPDGATSFARQGISCPRGRRILLAK